MHTRAHTWTQTHGEYEKQQIQSKLPEKIALEKRTEFKNQESNTSAPNASSGASEMSSPGQIIHFNVGLSNLSTENEPRPPSPPRMSLTHPHTHPNTDLHTVFVLDSQKEEND